MSKGLNDQWVHLRDSFLAGYQHAAAAMESYEIKREALQPIFHVAALLDQATTTQNQISQGLEQCQQALEEIEAMPAEEQEVARVELQQSLRHLLACCDAVSDYLRTSSSLASAVDEKGQQDGKQEDREEIAPPQTETGKKRSHRR
jgi:hypothetical protein